MKTSPALRLLILLSMFLTSAVWALDGECGNGFLPDLHARPWSAAERLFRRDSRWLGADGAHSVDLGKGSVLWLFGDTLIDPRAQGRRRHAAMIRNSIGIQHGADPTTAEMTFFWRTSAKGSPSPFFSSSAETWYWPGDGVRLGSRLLIFLAAVRRDSNPLGFALQGWRAVLIDNPDALPDSWQIAEVPSARQRFGIILGTGGVLSLDGFVYAYGCDASGGRAFLARWPVGDARAGNLGGTQWWCGRNGGWRTENQPQSSPAALFADGQSEFGVYHDARINRYVQIQTIGFGAADLGFRTAPQPQGPWTELSPFYQPLEKKIPGVLIYAAKPHAFLAGNGCAVTFATNHVDPQQLIGSASLYFPRVLRVAWHTAGASK